MMVTIGERLRSVGRRACAPAGLLGAAFLLSFSSAATAACAPETSLAAHRLAGAWTTTIETDEGWTGSGRSEIDVDDDRGCALIERASFSLDRGDGVLTKNEALTIYAWDGLEKTWKLFATDRRGYTHIARSVAPHGDGDDKEYGGEDDGRDGWTFDVQRPGGEAANRRIVLRPISGRAGFEWVWQGRDADAWSDRLISTYTRVNPHTDEAEL
ncbi:MAG: hypothetical protein AAGC56_08830 [Pseudomonadota bacterium]